MHSILFTFSDIYLIKHNLQKKTLKKHIEKNSETVIIPQIYIYFMLSKSIL